MRGPCLREMPNLTNGDASLSQIAVVQSVARSRLLLLLDVEVFQMRWDEDMVCDRALSEELAPDSPLRIGSLASLRLVQEKARGGTRSLGHCSEPWRIS